MKKLVKHIAVIAAVCLGLGFVVSKVEKAKGIKGWVEGHRAGFYEREIKRPLDFGLSLMALIVLWPMMLLTGLMVMINLGKPVLFKQDRPGLGGKVFTIRKYRTMRNGEGSDEKRLTGFGKKLRSTSMDELPELLNVIKGEMSIVGPRPLLVEYLSKYSEQQLHRHDVRPGLTGLAQINGRNELSWDKKFEDDVEYIGWITFLGDLRILAKTVAIVLGKKGISSKTSETMEVFTGNEECAN